jgi:hypothetical protein
MTATQFQFQLLRVAPVGVEDEPDVLFMDRFGSWTNNAKAALWFENVETVQETAITFLRVKRELQEPGRIVIIGRTGLGADTIRYKLVADWTSEDYPGIRYE